MIRDFESLENWELRVIEYIQKDPNFEIVLVLQDGRSNDDLDYVKNNGLFGFSNSLSMFGEKILQYQLEFERRRYLKNFTKADRFKIIGYLTSIPAIIINPVLEGNFDIIGNSDIQKIQTYNLDLILKHGFNQLTSEITKLPQHGIWLLAHSDFPTHNGNYPGLWEILKKHSVVCSTLLKLSDEKSTAITIDKAYFNRHRFSLIETMTKVQESSVSLVVKNLNKLISENELKANGEKIPLSDKKIIPFERVLMYIAQYYFSFFNGMITKVYGRFGYRKNRWSLFISKGQFMESNLSKIKPIRPPGMSFGLTHFYSGTKMNSTSFLKIFLIKQTGARSVAEK